MIDLNFLRDFMISFDELLEDFMPYELVKCRAHIITSCCFFAEFSPKSAVFSACSNEVVSRPHLCPISGKFFHPMTETFLYYNFQFILKIKSSVTVSGHPLKYCFCS